MLKLAIPVLHVSSSIAAEQFYCAGLGFRQTFAYRPDELRADPCYLGLVRDGVVLHLSSFSGDGVAGGVINFLVTDVDALHAEFVARGVPIALEPTDQTWGNREMYVKDADGNSIRFVRSGSSHDAGSKPATEA
ncbi:bleomycin resistance protein [Anatilimnocola floriformis]|uniref:bleomycin resistance protein n=1 Tax=Anatilimnocola floriformis TaxID=2948575 RepID=UPI0020C55788|nr:VOC family protein [Anatilimnocola floriformis]